MKTFMLILGGCILCNFLALAQPAIVSGEYFIDDYVDYGMGQILEMEPQQNLSLNTSLDVSSLSPGLHQLYLRFKDNEGRWSQTFSRVFFIAEPVVDAQISGFEYFFDAYQDIGHGTFVALEEGTVIYTLPTDELEPGLHTLFVRGQTSDGRWSLLNQKVFYVPREGEKVNIVRLEYYFQDESGTATSTYNFENFTPAPSLELQANDFVANTSELNEGEEYTLYVKAFADNGNASPLSSSTFVFQTVTAINIASIEKKDIECGETASGAITINASGGSGSLEYSLDGENYSSSNTFEELTAGDYTVYVKEEAGTYVESREVEVESLETPETPVIERQDNEEEIFLSVGNVSGQLQWYKDGSLMEGETNNTLVVEEGGSYSIEVTSQDECVALSDPFDVSLFPSLLIEITNIDCGETASGAITINTSDGSENLEYSLDGENYTTSNTFEGLTAGDYNVYVKEEAGSYVESREVEVESLETPETPAIEIKENEEETLLFVENVNGDIQWLKEGSPMEGATRDTLVVVESGSYSVEVASQDGCVVLSDPFDVSMVTSLLNVSLSEEISLYPNPAVNQLFIGLPAKIPAQTIMLSIFDLQGNRIANATVAYHTDKIISIKLPLLPTGVFLILIQGKEFLASKKFQKAH